MTAIERVRRTRAILGAVAAVNATAWGVAVALGILAAASFMTLAFSGIHSETATFRTIAGVAGTVTMATLLWRSRHLTYVGRVAIWIEERIPELNYALVTAVEQDNAAVFRDGMEGIIRRHDIGAVTRGAVKRSALPALAAAILAGALLYVSPSVAFGGRGTFLGSGGPAGVAADARSRLDGLSIEVTPPAYTGRRSETLSDPSSVTALVGSRVVVRGPGAATGISVSVGGQQLRATDSRRGWISSLAMPAKPAALTLHDRDHERIIVLDPRSDEPPKVVLTSPARDTTLRVAQLVIRLDAAATDDIGLSGGYFEYLVTTGSGEVFNARTITTPIVRFSGATRGSLGATLDLASLRLEQGDVVSIRAIVQDINTLSGPGLATSDTRTFRIARADEYDSVAVDPAGPLPIDSSAMSQRLLILMTEQLVREQKNLTRQELVRRSTEIGDLEDRIRKRVHEILFDQEGEEADAGAAAPEGPEIPDDHAHTDEPVPMHNADLFEAYNALWEAVRALQIAEPEPALPPMRVALRALDRARLANRVYLRGLPPKVIVDLARVRMTGKDKGSASVRTPLTAADSARVRLEAKFREAIDLIEAAPAEAVRAFTLLQVDALATSPSFAAAVGEAVDAFQRGRDATMPLLRARRALSGDPSVTPGLPSWSGTW